MCWSDARLLTSITILPSRCVFRPVVCVVFNVSLCLWCSWRNIRVILLKVWAQLGVLPASTMNIGHILFTRLLVKQTLSTVCPLMTDQVINLISFESSRSEPVNLSRLHCPPFLICKHLLRVEATCCSSQTLPLNMGFLAAQTHL